MRPARIPLFPLDVVLFPSMPLPLHIFEPRYKAMVSRCVDEGIEFGMVFAENRSIATIGCTAEITRTIKKYDDGRMDILTEGRAAFRIVEMLTEKEYYEAVVDYLPEDVTPQDAAEEAELTEAFQHCQLLLFGHPWHGCDKRDPTPFAYRLGARLPLDLKQRQALLETRNEDDRRGFLLQYCKALLPKLAQRQISRQRSGGNGHGVH
jgi:ATP-dependent Lon protease